MNDLQPREAFRMENRAHNQLDAYRRDLNGGSLSAEWSDSALATLKHILILHYPLNVPGTGISCRRCGTSWPCMTAKAVFDFLHLPTDPVV